MFLDVHTPLCQKASRGRRSVRVDNPPLGGRGSGGHGGVGGRGRRMGRDGHVELQQDDLVGGDGTRHREHEVPRDGEETQSRERQVVRSHLVLQSRHLAAEDATTITSGRCRRHTRAFKRPSFSLPTSTL